MQLLEEENVAVAIRAVCVCVRVSRTPRTVRAHTPVASHSMNSLRDYNNIHYSESYIRVTRTDARLIVLVTDVFETRCVPPNRILYVFATIYSFERVSERCVTPSL